MADAWCLAPVASALKTFCMKEMPNYLIISLCSLVLLKLSFVAQGQYILSKPASQKTYRICSRVSAKCLLEAHNSQSF